MTVEILMAVRSANAIKNWKNRYRYTAYRNKWYGVLALYLPMRKTRPTTKVKVTIVSVRARYLDSGNFVAGCKPILDALKKRNYIFDDSPRWISDSYEQVIDSKNQRTIITIGE